MAKVIFAGLEQSAARQLGRALAVGNHRVELHPANPAVQEILAADIVFAGGSNREYLSLLKELRKSRPSMPFVVVAPVAQTSEWLDALEAGATDYCAPPFEPHHLALLMEAACPSARTAAA